MRLNKTIIISFIMIFLMFSTLFMTKNITSTATSYTTSLEGTALAQYDDGILQTNKVSGTFSYLSATAKKTGTLGYLIWMGANYDNWFNFTLPAYQYIDYFNISISVEGGGGFPDNMYIDFVNSTGTVLSSIRFDSANVKYYSAGVGYTAIQSVEAGWQYLHIDKNTDGTYNYQYGGTEKTNCNPKATSDNGIKNIHFYRDGSVNFNLYLDDIYLTYTSTSEYCDYEYFLNLGYNSIGNVNTNTFMNPAYVQTVEHSWYGWFPSTEYVTYDASCLEEEYGSSFTPTSFVGFDLAVASDMRYKNNLSDFTLFFNNQAKGHPICWIPYDYYYLLRWNFTTPVTLTAGQKPLIEINNSYNSLDGGKYWLVGTRSNDLDGDGTIDYKSNLITDGIYNGWSYGNDLCYTLWYSGQPSETTGKTYTDMVWCEKPEGTHPTYNTPFYYTYSIIPLSYTLSEIGTANTYLYIYKDGVTTGTTQNFPRLCKTVDGTFYFVAYDTGNYTASLYKNDVNISGANCTFYVYDNPNANKTIWSIPAVTDYYIPYDVYYRYQHSSSFNGAIVMFYETSNIRPKSLAEIISDESTVKYHQFLNVSNTSVYSGAFRYYPDESLTQNIVGNYWTFMVENDGYYYPYGDIHKHGLINPVLTENTITAVPEELLLGEVVNIHGYHRHIFSNIAVFINNEYVAEVGEASYYNIYYTTIREGFINVTLKLFNNGSWITLASDTFTVYGSGADEDEGYNIIPKIAQPLGSIVGLIITVFMLLTPFMISGALHLTVPIHPVIYAFTGSLGIAISTVLGLFPIWIPFFVLVCGIITIVIYVLKGTDSSGE